MHLIFTKNDTIIYSIIFFSKTLIFYMFYKSKHYIYMYNFNKKHHNDLANKLHKNILFYKQYQYIFINLIKNSVFSLKK